MAIPLAREIEKAMAGAGADVFILGNHGWSSAADANSPKNNSLGSREAAGITPRRYQDPTARCGDDAEVLEMAISDVASLHALGTDACPVDSKRRRSLSCQAIFPGPDYASIAACVVLSRCRRAFERQGRTPAFVACGRSGYTQREDDQRRARHLIGLAQVTQRTSNPRNSLSEKSGTNRPLARRTCLQRSSLWRIGWERKNWGYPRNAPLLSELEVVPSWILCV